MKNILRKTDHKEQALHEIKAGKVIKISDFIKDNSSNEVGEKDKQIKGFPVSIGVVTGTAVVITDQAHLKNIEENSVIVCKNASPDLTLYYPMIKGLVTDTGGSLNPAASAAREYHIPAVFGTGHATETIKTGDTITIEGNSGIVKIH